LIPAPSEAKLAGMSDTPIRDAATVIIVRDAPDAPRILMGQRGKSAVFMPNKYVFPGGAVDDGDADIALAAQPDPACLTRLAQLSDPKRTPALLASAIREVWEETGLFLGEPAQSQDATPPPDWQGFFDAGFTPSARGLRYIFRAITPPGRPRRFDARFFLADASALQGDLDDFSRASDELSHLHWVPISEARALDLPFITEVVLAEVEALSKTKNPPESVPFFKNDTDQSQFLRIR
jgi:8-oxo-dGTP pyrophosphatase MutT (NUDIX family)